MNETRYIQSVVLQYMDQAYEMQEKFDTKSSKFKSGDAVYRNSVVLRKSQEPITFENVKFDINAARFNGIERINDSLFSYMSIEVIIAAGAENTGDGNMIE